MPLVYEDSLSYYETLCKVVKKLNEVIESVDGIPDLIAELISDEHIGEIVSRLLDNLEEQIASANEGVSETATADRIVGCLVWLNGDLYRATKYIDAGDRYVAGGNVEKITIEEVIKDLQLAITDNYEDGERVASADREVGELVWFKNELLLVKQRIDEGNAYTDANSEVVDFSSLFLTIENAISNEATARANADTALGTQITNEVTARENADTTINNKIGNLAGLETSEKTNLVGAINEVFENAEIPLNALTPDDFTGTDGEKIQSAFDALEANGGTIVIDRAYTLDRDILIKRRTTAPNFKTITIIGIGRQSEIDFGDYCFMGYDTEHRDYGGLIFIGVNFLGNEKAFKTDYLIRLHFDGCTFWDFKFVFWGYEDVSMQSVYVDNCVFDRLVTNLLYSRNDAYDVHFNNCRVELCDNPFYIGGAKVFTITNCLIEGKGISPAQGYIAIKIVNTYEMLVISGNYFEANETSIDMSTCTNHYQDHAVIQGNGFWEHNDSIKAIILPESVSHAQILIDHNMFNIYGSSAYAISVYNTGHDLTGVQINACNGSGFSLYDPEYRLVDEADYNEDTITPSVNYTNNTASPLRFKRDGKMCTLNGIITLEQNVGAGDTILTVSDRRICPDSRKFFTISKLSGAAVASVHRGNVGTDGSVYCQEALSNGDMIAINATWVC